MSQQPILPLYREFVHACRCPILLSWRSEDLYQDIPGSAITAKLEDKVVFDCDHDTSPMSFL